ncbi:hypothetical protein HY772_01050 [Candidatus Woesearchaeota archaeon]|nr:hypothetical protein [Candidatus Woesearchaeota archaeon]
MEEKQTAVFVKIDDYKDVLDVVDLIKNKLTEARATISQINDLKAQEDHELELWYNEITDVEHKVEFIDHALLEPENQ